MDKEPFDLVLSDDGATLAIVINEPRFDYSASDLDRLIQLLSVLRARMSPPLPSASDDLFSYALSADKLSLTLLLREAKTELSADKVVRLALFFANLRAEMSPAVPDKIQPDEAAAEADRYEIFGNPQDHQDGTRQIYLRIPGLCWAFTQLSKEQSLRLAETLNPPPSAPENSARH